MSIVLELQKEAMKSDKDIITVLKMALEVSYKLNLTDFEIWIGKELEGYTDDEILPSYRKVRGMLEYYDSFHGNWDDMILSTYEDELFYSISNISDSTFYLYNLTNTGAGNLKINIS